MTTATKNVWKHLKNEQRVGKVRRESGEKVRRETGNGSGVLYYMAVAQWQKNVHDLWLAQWPPHTHKRTQSPYLRECGCMGDI